MSRPTHALHHHSQPVELVLSLASVLVAAAGPLRADATHLIHALHPTRAHNQRLAIALATYTCAVVGTLVIVLVL